MRDFFKQNAPGLAGVLLGGLLGLFLLLFPQTTANIVFFIFGTALIVAGVVHAILYFADDARNAIGGWQLAMMVDYTRDIYKRIPALFS